jgi:hypothetical protein
MRTGSTVRSFAFVVAALVHMAPLAIDPHDLHVLFRRSSSPQSWDRLKGVYIFVGILFATIVLSCVRFRRARRQSSSAKEIEGMHRGRAQGACTADTTRSIDTESEPLPPYPNNAPPAYPPSAVTTERVRLARYETDGRMSTAVGAEVGQDIHRAFASVTRLEPGIESAIVTGRDRVPSNSPPLYSSFA